MVESETTFDREREKQAKHERLADAAAANLRAIYEDMATAEAITRALVSERTEQPDRADFWVSVFQRLRSTRHSEA